MFCELLSISSIERCQAIRLLNTIFKYVFKNIFIIHRLMGLCNYFIKQQKLLLFIPTNKLNYIVQQSYLSPWWWVGHQESYLSPSWVGGRAISIHICIQVGWVGRLIWWYYTLHFQISRLIFVVVYFLICLDSLDSNLGNLSCQYKAILNK